MFRGQWPKLLVSAGSLSVLSLGDLAPCIPAPAVMEFREWGHLMLSPGAEVQLGAQSGRARVSLFSSSPVWMGEHFVG